MITLNALGICLHSILLFAMSLRGDAPNGTELSRCDRGGEAAEGAVGWSELLGGISFLSSDFQ